MKTTGNTILITGGGSGIGFEFARQMIANNNHVIIVGRNTDRLKAAAEKLGNIPFITADITNGNDADQLLETVSNKYPEVNVLINNAGTASDAHIINDSGLYEKAAQEMTTNYLSTIRMNEKFLPLLKMHPDAAIVHVSSVTAFVPALALATYSASKAALHSYTQSLRLGLSGTTVKVFVMPPLVNTAFSASVGGQNGIPPARVAEEFLVAMGEDRYEVRIADTEDLYRLYLTSPKDALLVLNKWK